MVILGRYALFFQTYPGSATVPFFVFELSCMVIYDGHHLKMQNPASCLPVYLFVVCNA